MTGQNENCCKHKGPFLSFLSNSWLKPSAKSTHFIAMVEMLVFFNVFLAVAYRGLLQFFGRVGVGQGLRKLQIVFKRGFPGKMFCEKNLPKSAPPPPQKMPFSSDLCHFKTTLAQFQKKSGKILIFVLFFPMCPPQIFCEIPIWPSFSASGAWALERLSVFSNPAHGGDELAKQINWECAKTTGEGRVRILFLCRWSHLRC